MERPKEAIERMRTYANDGFCVGDIQASLKTILDWLEASNLFEPDARQIILRALSLLASVEDEDGIVGELRETYKWRDPKLAELCDKAASHILALKAELASVKADAESSGDEVVRELHALRESAKPFPSGAGGQQCGMESYRIVASGNQLEVIYTAAARIAALEYHAEAMAAYLSGYLRSVTSDKLVSAYREEFPLRAAHPKDAP